MLQPPNSPPVSNKSSLAFGIKFTDRQGHVALIYRNEELKTLLLHLCGHQDLRHEAWDSTYHWIEFSELHVEVEETFADWAVMVAGNSDLKNIPYSTILSEDRNFALDGSFISRGDSTGLTCASFLLAMFADHGLPLVDQKSWPRGRISDIRWAQRMLERLHDRFPGTHFAAQLQRVFKIKRFRPEEIVVTPALYRGSPLKAKELQAPAKLCLVTLDKSTASRD